MNAPKCHAEVITPVYSTVYSTYTRIRLGLILVLLMLTLSACSQKSNNQGSVSDSTLSAAVPDTLMAVIFDASNLVVELVVDGGEPQACTGLTVDHVNRTFSCSIILLAGARSLSLIYSIDTKAVAFGIVNVTTTSAINVNIVAGQTTPVDFSTTTLTYLDLDEDGITNLEEINAGTDPTVATIPDTWEARASMLTQRSAMGSGVIDGKIYLVGGGDGGTYFSTVEAYDPTTNTWTTKTPMSTTRNYLGVGVINGILYAVGGLSGGSALASVEAYDPTTNLWTPRPPMNFARYDLAVAVVDGILYAIGGESGFDELDIVEAYDPVTDIWTTKQSMPIARDRLAVAVVDGIVYAIGGEDATNNVIASVVAYDPLDNTWSTRAPMSTARRGLAAGVVNGFLYAIGGFNGEYQDLVEVYNPATDSWTSKTVAPMANVRLSPTVSLVGSHLYVFGGCCVAMDSTEVLVLPPDGTIPPIQEFTVRDIPPDGTPDVFVGGNPPPKFLFVKLTEDRAVMEFDISSIPTSVQYVSLRFTMSTLDPGGSIGSVSMHSSDADGSPDLTDFFATGSPVIFNGPNVSGNVTYNFDVSAAVSDARNRNVDYIGFLFLITDGVGSDRYDIKTTDGLAENAPLLEVFQ